MNFWSGPLRPHSVNPFMGQQTYSDFLASTTPLTRDDWHVLDIPASSLDPSSEFWLNPDYSHGIKDASIASFDAYYVDPFFGQSKPEASPTQGLRGLDDDLLFGSPISDVSELSASSASSTSSAASVSSASTTATDRRVVPATSANRPPEFSSSLFGTLEIPEYGRPASLISPAYRDDWLGRELDMLLGESHGADGSTAPVNTDALPKTEADGEPTESPCRVPSVATTRRSRSPELRACSPLSSVSSSRSASPARSDSHPPTPFSPSRSHSPALPQPSCSHSSPSPPPPSRTTKSRSPKAGPARTPKVSKAAQASTPYPKRAPAVRRDTRKAAPSPPSKSTAPAASLADAYLPRRRVTVKTLEKLAACVAFDNGCDGESLGSASGAGISIGGRATRSLGKRRRDMEDDSDDEEQEAAEEPVRKRPTRQAKKPRTDDEEYAGQPSRDSGKTRRGANGRHRCTWPGCAELLVRKADIQRHIDRVHCGLTSLCPICDKKLSRDDAVKRHMISTHGMEL